MLEEFKPSFINVYEKETNILHITDYAKGKYFEVVTNNDDGFAIKTGKKTAFKVLYIKDPKNDIRSFEIIKDARNKEKVSLNLEGFSQMIAFLELIKSLDIKGLTEQKMTINSSSEYDIDDETRKKILTLLKTDNGLEVIETLLKDESLTSKDLVNIGYRKSQLKLFEEFIADEEKLQEYANLEGRTDKKPEKIWQYFFNKNNWIFGYGLDYRIQTNFDSEVSVGDGGTQDQEKPSVDFLNTYTNFTVLVELKKPTTELFKNSTSARSGTCGLSSELITGYTQCLEQKAEWQIKSDHGKNRSKDGTKELEQRTRDPKVFLVIGNLGKEVLEETNLSKKDLMLDTFELFRRDSRNVEIITYDELYERAKFIVENYEKS